ncbi:E1-like protein-activating enzyme Gsa7p/Apg7p [Cryptococcus sp. DSM 104549]
MPPLLFQPLSSQPTPAFWAALTSQKLENFRLDQSPRGIVGWVDESKEVVDREQAVPIGIDGSVIINDNAFTTDSPRPFTSGTLMNGVLKVFNTVEEFRQTKLKKSQFEELTSSMMSSMSTDNPCLNHFLLVVYADLKKYEYHYWFAFPAFFTDVIWDVEHGGFEPVPEEDIIEIRRLETEGEISKDPYSGAFLVKGSRGQRQLAPIHQLKTLYKDSSADQVTVAFHDPSSTENPGWPLRNVLFYLNGIHSVCNLTVICLRQGVSRQALISASELSRIPPVNSKVKMVGWERDQSGKLSSRVVNLRPMMDPAVLAEQAVDLNLKLMRWRIMPSLDITRIGSTKCLLLGAGTLGCYVARVLMGWGIRNISLVDSGHVSFSNPVRQPLFNFDDCLDGGKPKAECAADSLRRIFPGVNVSSHILSIPMPGHPVPQQSEDTVIEDVKRLIELVRSHDAIFLLTDSRESRWLPTVMGAAEGKIVINAALGFDSFLVMRHGAGLGGAVASRLGCYFCNDVVAPTDSLTDRTLDQMCTVTRPGVAPIAAALAVELLINICQHPQGLLAPASLPGNESLDESPLGPVPHQLRGSLSTWKTLMIKGAAFSKCTGCSESVITAYQQGGAQFLLRVFNEDHFLEKLTGLDQLHLASEALLSNISWSDSSDEDSQ